MMTRAPDILFYREERPPDGFRIQFEGEGYSVGFMPLLRTEFPVFLGPPPAAEAVVVTSGRAMDALERNAELFDRVRLAAGEVPWFAIGALTQNRIRQMDFRPQPVDAVRAAELLDPTILSDARSVLFLTGDPHRPELEKCLSARGVKVHTYVVYRTDVIPVQPAPEEITPEWIVLFSPRGSSIIADSGLEPARTRIAVIGATTARAARDCGFSVDAVAARPEPSALLEAIRTAAGSPDHANPDS